MIKEQTGLNEKFLTAGQTAKWLNISVPQTYRLIEAGLLPHYNFGIKTIRVGEKDLIDFVRRHRIKIDPN